jgi:hypothetical protein
VLLTQQQDSLRYSQAFHHRSGSDLDHHKSLFFFLSALLIACVCPQLGSGFHPKKNLDLKLDAYLVVLVKRKRGDRSQFFLFLPRKIFFF